MGSWIQRAGNWMPRQKSRRQQGKSPENSGKQDRDLFTGTRVESGACASETRWTQFLVQRYLFRIGQATGWFGAQPPSSLAPWRLARWLVWLICPFPGMPFLPLLPGELMHSLRLSSIVWGDTVSCDRHWDLWVSIWQPSPSWFISWAPWAPLYCVHVVFHCHCYCRRALYHIILEYELGILTGPHSNHGSPTSLPPVCLGKGALYFNCKMGL